MGGFEPLKYDTNAFRIMIALSSACLIYNFAVTVALLVRVKKHPIP